jgi:hypothetical protein
MRKSKPIRVFYSELSRRFYASSQYRVDGKAAVITGSKTDVTDDIAQAIVARGIVFSPTPPVERKELNPAKLKGYAVHSGDCRLLRSAGADSFPKECTCGLAALLSNGEQSTQPAPDKKGKL